MHGPWLRVPYDSPYRDGLKKRFGCFGAKEHPSWYVHTQTHACIHHACVCTYVHMHEDALPFRHLYIDVHARAHAHAHGDMYSHAHQPSAPYELYALQP